MLKLFFKLIFLLSLFVAQCYANKTHFTISYDPDYAPFSYKENGKPEGLLIDIWNYWAEENGYTLEFVNGIMWDDAIELSKNQKVDFFLGTEKYENWMQASKPFYSTTTTMFTHSDNQKDINPANAYRIGIIGSDYKEVINKNFINSQIFVYEKYTDIVQDLINKKIDLLYDDKLAIEFFTLQNRYFHHVKPIELLKEKTFIQAISHSKELASIFTEGYKHLSLHKLYEIETKWILNKNDLHYKKQPRKLKLTIEELDFLENTTFNISVSKGWKPFSFQNQDGVATGISSEIWQLITNKINIKTNTHFYDSFTKQLKDIESKRTDVIYSTGKTKERESFALFTKPYISFPISIATKKDENFIESASQIIDKKIAVGKNFTAHKMLKSAYPIMNFVLVNSIQEGLEAVSSGNAYAYADIKPNLYYNINKLGLEDIKITGNTGLNFNLRIMIRDDYPLLKSILDKTIEATPQAEFQHISERWGSVQFKKSFDYTKLWIIVAITALIFIIFFIRMIIIRKNNQYLKELVDQRTLELKKLNRSLEKRIHEKTRALREANNLLQEAQEIAHLGSYQYNLQKDELIWSNEHFKIMNLEVDSIIPSIQEFFSLIHPDDREKVFQAFEQAKTSHEQMTYEYRLLFEDKSIKFVQSTSHITKYDEKGKPLLMIGTLLDLTKVKTLEIEKSEKENILAQQTKMAAMGEMLENIAHQWRQPLSVISTSSTGLQVQLELGELKKDEILDSVNAINDSAQYLSKTIDDFRNFFNPNKLRLDFKLEDMLTKTLSITHSKIKTRNIIVNKNIEDLCITGLENELIQVIINLINNAIDALDKTNYEKKLIFINVTKKGKQVLIKVKDNAGGVGEDIIHRIFEPYFTTKHKSQGTGIGLYMSSEIITKHFNGTFKVINKSYVYDTINYKGAEFIISIPTN